ncbi:long-chain fatty acid--CoA ligase [Ramlibacter ginsenosidimutans]|uniref:Long-chain fatty acid--CoA ligase n=1 Tax=Ramlibacter ginsenosidimutans TaxID=502333 RepID=A0A934TW79_9BURK|nr:AMP-dependent synthetase/ligase [Ramlibacter ginsenosidimutans]MBK6008146.1 long-chain fatty acid--CoA ligase [Ramlibacter ginsenosidimutans]
MTHAPAAPADLAAVRTLAAVLRWRVAQTPEGDAYRSYDEARQAWVTVSWREVEARVQQFARALQALGVSKGERVAVLLPNGLDAVCVDQAALALGCVPLPMHALDNPGSIAYILADSEAAVLVADTRAQWQAIAAAAAVPATLRHVVLRECGPAADDGTPLLALDVALARGASLPLDAQLAAVPDEEDLAALVYTSGTTGKPKGVMLTHANVLANVKAILQHLQPRSDDVFLSFLPLSHTFERTCGYYLPIACGACVAFARSASHLPQDLKAVRPTILVSVPRIYERVYAKVQAALEPSPLRHRLFQWAQAVGWRRFARAQKLPVEQGDSSALDALAWPLLSRLVAQPLLANFGGRLRVAVSGGAALSQPIAHTFLGLGLPIVQGYGMTESSPVVAANTPDDNDPATVGRVLPGVEVKIGANQELLVRGPNVMRGYWKRPEDTARALEGGWLHTGDQAAIEAGRVRILGRVKEIIVTSTGEKIAPVDVEMALLADPLFEQAWTFGDNRPFIAAVVVLGREPWERLARTLGLDPADSGSLRAPEAVHAVLDRMRELTRGLPYYAQPRAVALVREPWTVENGLITPTLKLKRNNLVARYGDLVEGLYRR